MIPNIEFRGEDRFGRIRIDIVFRSMRSCDKVDASLPAVLMIIIQKDDLVGIGRKKEHLSCNARGAHCLIPRSNAMDEVEA